MHPDGGTTEEVRFEGGLVTLENSSMGAKGEAKFK